MYKIYGDKFKENKDFSKLYVSVDNSKFTRKELVCLRWLLTNIKNICSIMRNTTDNALSNYDIYIIKPISYLYKTVLLAYLNQYHNFFSPRAAADEE
jgi:hypothetical protein